MSEQLTGIKFYAYLGGAWIDITDDYFGDIDVQWGGGNSPLDVVADIGEISFTLFNADGKYYPDGDAPLSGWGFGVPIKWVCSYEGGDYVRFRGYVEDIQLNVGDTANQNNVKVKALDWMIFADRYPLLAPNIELSKRADEGIQTILTGMPTNPIHTSLDAGRYTFPVIFDGVAMRTTAYSEFAKLALSEYGYLSVIKDSADGETLRFEKYPGQTLLPTHGTIDADIDGVELKYGKEIINRATAIANPKRIDETPQVLYRLDKPMPIRSGQTINFRAKYTDPKGGGTRVNAIVSTMLEPEEPGAVDPYLMTLLNFTDGATDETGRHTWTAGDYTNIFWNDVYVDGYGTAYSNNILGKYLVTGGYPNYNLTAPTSDDFEFGSGAFTVGWYENLINPAVGNTAMARDNDYIPPFLLGYPTANNRMAVWFSSNGITYDIGFRRDLGEINVGRWTYYEVSRDEDGWFYCFSDGKLTDKWYSPLAIKSSTGAWTIGQTRTNDWAWMAFDSFFIKKGQCLHKSDFERPLRNIKPTLDGDYLLNTKEDGTGTDISDQLTVSASYGTEAVTYTLTKAAGSSSLGYQDYITHLQARGRGVYPYSSIENSVEDSTSYETYNYKEITIDQKYQQNLTAGNLLITDIVANQKDPKTNLDSISFFANRSAATMYRFLNYDIGTLVHPTKADAGIDNFYRISSVKFSLKANGVIYVTYGLRPAPDMDASAPPPVSPDFVGTIRVQDIRVGVTVEDVDYTQTYSGTVSAVVDDLTVGVIIEAVVDSIDAISVTPGGFGDVFGPASATDDNLATFDGVTGKLIQDSGITAASVSSAISASHAAVTVSDTASIDLTLVGQALSAAAIFGTGAGVVAEGNHTHSGLLSDGDKGDITVSGSGATWTIDNDTVTLAKMANMATASLIYRKTAGTGDPEVNTLATLKTDLGLTGTNSGDQTSIVGITGTKAQFDTAVTDGNILYVGDVTQYTDELAQDAVGGMLLDTATIDLTYTDATPTLSADVKDASITFAKMQHIATDRLLGRDTALSGDVEEISLDDTLEFTGAGAVQRAALTGAITATAGSNTTALGSFTTAQLNTALSDNDIATGGGSATGANTVDVTLAGTPNYLTIAGQAITRALIALSHMADVATSTVFYRKTAGTGSPEVQTLATLKTDLGLTGTNSGDQTITLSGDVSGTGTGAITTAIGANKVTLAMQATLAANSAIANATGSTATPTAVSMLATASASSIALRDANANLVADNFIEGFRTQATAAGTTTLVVGDAKIQEFTGATTQTVTLPVVSTLALGQQFLIINQSSGAVTVNSSGGNLVQTVAAGTSALVICVLITGTTAASWEVQYHSGINLSDGDKGDITVSASGATWTIDNDAVTYAKMQNVSATDRVLGRTTAGAGDVEEIATTGSGNVVRATSPTLVTPALGTPSALTLTNATGLPVAGITASTSTALGVGSVELGHATDTTIARSSAGNVTIEGNLIYRAGGTDVPVADGGTGASDAATARTNLGLTIGSNVQAYDAELAALAGLTSAANALPYFTGSGTAAVTTLSAAARTVLDDATVTDMLATMGGAPLASPALTGTPTAPTAAAGTNTTQIATTAFVTTAAREKLTANRTYYVGYDMGTCTMTIATPCVVTDATHGLSINDPVVFRTTGALPTGITAGTTYYIISAGFAAGSFRVSTSVGGAAVNTSGSQSGTHSYHTGNNANAGLTTGRAGAFLTIQKAVDTLNTIDIQSYAVTVQVSDGLFTTPIVITSPWLGLGAGSVTIQGNSGTPANCVISTTSANALNVKNGGQIIIKDLKVITTTTGYSFLSQDYGVINFTNINFGASAYEHLSTANGAIEATGNYTISGGARRHVSNFAGQVRIQNRTVTTTGTPAWSIEGVLSQGGVVYINGNTYAGTGATGTRYLANNNGVIYTNSGGATYLPGSVAGSVATGGQYT